MPTEEERERAIAITGAESCRAAEELRRLKAEQATRCAEQAEKARAQTETHREALDAVAKVRPIFHKPTDAQLENRYSYHPPKGDQVERYAAIRAKVCELAKFVRDNTPVCPDQSLAFGALDEVMFRANAAIARNE